MRLKLQQQWLHTYIFNCLIKIIDRDNKAKCSLDIGWDMSLASLLPTKFNTLAVQYIILF